MKVKRFLEKVMLETLRPIRERREELAKDPGAVLEMLRVGSLKARETAADTLDRVKSAMGINYYS